jgi:hypothetical protein
LSATVGAAPETPVVDPVVERLVADMTHREGRPSGVPDSMDWATDPRVGMGNEPGDWRAVTAWGQVYEEAGGNPAGNSLVNISGITLHLLRRESNFHFWPPDRAGIDPADVAGLVVAVRARLVLDDPAGPDDRWQARLLLGAGGDYWESTTAVWDEFRTNGDFAIGRFAHVTPQEQLFTAHTLTEEQVRANPPPLVAPGSPAAEPSPAESSPATSEATSEAGGLPGGVPLDDTTVSRQHEVNGDISIVDDHGRSGVIRSETFRSGNGEKSRAEMRLATLQPGDFGVQFDVLVDESTAEGGATLLQWIGPPWNRAAGHFRTEDGSYVFGNADEGPRVLGPARPGEWVTIRIEVEDMARVRVRYDGQEVEPIEGDFLRGQRDLGLRIGTYASRGGLSFLDDIRVLRCGRAALTGRAASGLRRRRHDRARPLTGTDRTKGSTCSSPPGPADVWLCSAP